MSNFWQLSKGENPAFDLQAAHLMWPVGEGMDLYQLSKGQREYLPG